MAILASQTTAQQTSGDSHPRWWVWLVVIVIAALIATAGWFGMRSLQADPYSQAVLSLTGDAERGGDIFMMNCSTCHGADAAGRVGPSLKGVSDRKSQWRLIEQVVSGKTPPMPQFQPNPQDMADLLSYLKTL